MKEVHFMHDYKVEFEKRVNFIKSVLAESGAKGIVYGNSGGKDSALVGILCKAACPHCCRKQCLLLRSQQERTL